MYSKIEIMPKKKRRANTFTMQRLQELEEEYGTLNVGILLGAFPDLTRRDITIRLHQNRASGLLTYEDYDKEIVLLKVKNPVADDELGRFRTWLAVTNAYRLTHLIDSKNLKPKEELEAIKELGRIERGLTNPKATEYAKHIEELSGYTNIWQQKKPC